MWATTGKNSVAEVRVSDGTILNTLPVASDPHGIAFDGRNIWVASLNGGAITKLRASDGKVFGTFPRSGGPWGIAFDGANIWVSNFLGSNVWKM